MPYDGIKGDASGIPVVGVLLEHDLCTVCIFGHIVRTVGDVGGGIGCPCFSVSFDGSLLNRNKNCECTDLIEVYAGVIELNHEGLGIGSGNCKSVYVSCLCFLIALYVVQKVVAVRSCCLGIRNPLPGINEILSCKIRTVRPLETVP